MNISHDYLKLVPTCPQQCELIDCSKCHNVWSWNEYDYDNECWFEAYMCKCKTQMEDEDIESWLDTWSRCDSKGIYKGYFDSKYSRYLPLFLDYLNYIEQAPSCSCFWPELSPKATFISNKACGLFKNLLNTTCSSLVEDKTLQSEFLGYDSVFNIHGLTVNFVSHALLFTDYEWICRDIEYFSLTHFDWEKHSRIVNQLDDIRQTLAELFIPLYKECLKQHPHHRIEQELYLASAYLGLQNSSIIHQDPLIVLSSELREDNTSCSKGIVRPENAIQSEVQLTIGTTYNSALLYRSAISVLTEAIRLNPHNRNAYLERAAAYFETDQLELALKDYGEAKKLTFMPPFQQNSEVLMPQYVMYFPENKMDFSKGLIEGTYQGAKKSGLELLPSILGSFRGICCGLWAFALSPIEVSSEMINTAYALGEFISQHSANECLECVIPEIKELSLTWHQLDDNGRGRNIGFIIGRYGVDVFAPLGAVKGANKVLALKRANTLATLEACSISDAHRKKVLLESTRRAFLRNMLLEKGKDKILVKTENVKYHVLQPKHAWNRLIELTGDVEKDFKKIIEILEREKIADPKFIKEDMEAVPIDGSELWVTTHEKPVNESVIEAVFETYSKTDEVYLKNAFIRTK